MITSRALKSGTPMDEPLKVTKILRVLSLEACQQSLGDKKPISNTEGSELSQGEEDK